MKVAVTNPEVLFDEKTYLTANYSSGVNLVVRNNEGFTPTWFVVVGEPGQELTEAQRVVTTTDYNIVQVAAALKFAHPKATTLALCQWNKIDFERKPAGGSYNMISGSPFDIEWDDADNCTTIVVPSGQSTDTYRWRFFNSSTGEYSDYSDALTGTGYARNTVGYVIQQVRRNPVAASVEDEAIISFMNDFQTDVVFPEMPKAWWFFKEGTAVATAASTYKYAISANWSDFQSNRFMLYNYVSGAISETYPLTFSPLHEFYNLKADSTQPTDDRARQWTLMPPDGTSAKGYIGIHPTPKTTACFLKPVYQLELTDLNSFGDTIVVPHPKGYIDYCLARIFDDYKSDSENADKYQAKVKQDIIFLKRLARRQLGQPEFFRFRGQRGWSRLFGEGHTQSEDAEELYW